MLETVIARFPCRAIVVLGSDDPGRRIAAEVSALCHLPAPGLPQVCSERIVLRAGPNAIDLIPGAVRPLLEAELPVVLWWTGDPRTMSRCSATWPTSARGWSSTCPTPAPTSRRSGSGLDPTLCPFSRDTAWFGLTRWRELVAQFFDPPCSFDALKRIDAVRIEVLSPDLSPAAPHRRLAGGLAGRPARLEAAGPSHSPGDGFRIDRPAEFIGPNGTVTVEITTRPVPSHLPPLPRLAGVAITAKLTKGAERRDVSTRSPGARLDGRPSRFETTDSCRLPRLVEAPELDAAHRVGAALESSRVDPPFHNALPIALWLLGLGG